MTLAGLFAILFILFMVLGVVFSVLPTVGQIKWTPHRESLMYRTAFWLVILGIASVVLSLVCLVKGY